MMILFDFLSGPYVSKGYIFQTLLSKLRFDILISSIIHYFILQSLEELKMCNCPNAYGLHSIIYKFSIIG